MIEHFVVYEHPSDFPSSWVIRRWEIVGGLGDARPVPDARPMFIGSTYESVVAMLNETHPHLFCIDRSVGDDPAIKEIWI